MPVSNIFCITQCNDRRLYISFEESIALMNRAPDAFLNDQRSAFLRAYESYRSTSDLSHDLYALHLKQDKKMIPTLEFRLQTGTYRISNLLQDHVPIEQYQESARLPGKRESERERRGLGFKKSVYIRRSSIISVNWRAFLPIIE